MKKRNLFISLGLALGLGVGVFAGLSARQEVKEAKAATYTGSIFIQKDDEDMKWTGSKLAAYFFDGDSHNAWGSAVANDGHKYQEYSWSLSFEPTTIIVLRVYSDWNNEWAKIYDRTGNVSLSGIDVIWMNSNAWDDNSDWGSYSMETLVMSNADVKLAELDNYKITSDGENLEAFGEVSLEANQQFYIKKTIDGATKYKSYTCLDLIEDNLSTVGDYIKVTAAADYEFYFNFNAKTLYITDPVVAAADEWAQDFLSSNCTATKTGWTTAATAYSALDPEVKTLISGQEHVDHAVDTSSSAYVVQAVQRYDYVLQRFGVNAANTDEAGYADFMGRVGSKLSLSRTTVSPLSEQSSNNSPILIIVIVGSVTLLAAAGYFMIKRRKED